MPDFGPYWRWQNRRTQTLADAVAQYSSGQLWGGIPRDGGLLLPAVKAYEGELPEDKHGIEFLAEVAPSRRRGGGVWMWELGTSGVFEVEDRVDLAGINIEVVRINQYKEEP